MLALALAAMAGFVVGVGAVPCARRLTTKRIEPPVQVINGHVFPHPEDDRWEASSVATVYRIGALRVIATSSTHGLVSLGEVDIANGSGPAAKYAWAVHRAHKSRVMAKALEAIP